MRNFTEANSDFVHSGLVTVQSLHPNTQNRELRRLQREVYKRLKDNSPSLPESQTQQHLAKKELHWGKGAALG